MQTNIFLAAHNGFFCVISLPWQKQVTKKCKEKNTLGWSPIKQFLKQAIYNSSCFIVIVSHMWSYIPHALGATYSIA